MRWPWQREHRGSDYSEVVQNALLALAEGKAASSPYATAAVESCAGLWARGFAQAIVTPSGLLTASTLYDLGRDLALSGEFVALLDVGKSGPVFTRPSSFSVRGGPNPDSWIYDLWLPGPTSAVRVQVGRDRVIHVRINTAASTPWKGRSPISAARSTGRLLSELEGALAHESSVPVGRVVTTPEGPNQSGKLQADLNKIRGKIVLVESTSGGYGDKGAAPKRDWAAQRIGPDFTAAQIELRKLVESSVCACFGIHAGLLSGNLDGSGMRESYRRFQRSTLESLSACAVLEFERVFERPIEFDFARLRASDTAGQARAFRALAGKGAKVDQERALSLSGLSSSDLEPERNV